MKKPEKPQLIAIVGPNGSGKSSSVAILMTILILPIAHLFLTTLMMGLILSSC